jgi:hypothetical protein
MLMFDWSWVGGGTNCNEGRQTFTQKAGHKLGDFGAA